MFAKEATSSQYQFDWRWVKRFRELDAFDAYWWWTPAGSFTEEEQQQWNKLHTSQLDETTRTQLSILLEHTRERELALAFAQEREPHFIYPALDIAEVRSRISGLLNLDAEILQAEPNAIVRRLYHETINESISFLRLFEATYEGDTTQFWQHNQEVFPIPTAEEMEYAFNQVKQVLQEGLQHEETVHVSQQVIHLMRDRLHLSFSFSTTKGPAQEGKQEQEIQTPLSASMLSPQAITNLFEALFLENGYVGWQVIIDPKASSAYVEAGLKQIFLPDYELSLEQVKHYLAHEMVGHVERAVSGERSLLGLLAIGTKNYQPTEEGLALYEERREAAVEGQDFNDWSSWIGTLAVGLAAGVITPPQTFRHLFTFFNALLLLRRLLEHWDDDVQIAPERAKQAALIRCLRTYRGVPNLKQAGICLTKDAVYLRGLRLIEQAVAQDETLLDRLTVGKVAIEYLPDLQELGIVPSASSLRKLIHSPRLEEYILSFEVNKHQSDKQVSGTRRVNATGL